MYKPALLSLTLLMPALCWAAPQQGTTRNDSASGMTFVYFPAGCFQMGSAEGSDDEKPVHKVCLEKGLWLGLTEVT